MHKLLRYATSQAILPHGPNPPMASVWTTDLPCLISTVNPLLAGS